MTKVGGIRKIMVLWQAVFLAASPLVTASPSNLTRLYYNGSAAKSHSTTTQYRQLRRLLKTLLLSMAVSDLGVRLLTHPMGTLDSRTQTKGRKWVSFELSTFILGLKAEGNKTKEINYSTLNLHAISFLVYPQPRNQVWILSMETTSDPLRRTSLFTGLLFSL